MNDVDDMRPDEDRHPVQRHARRAQLEMVVMSADGDGQRRHFGERDQLRPDVGALAVAVVAARPAADS